MFVINHQTKYLCCTCVHSSLHHACGRPTLHLPWRGVHSVTLELLYPSSRPLQLDTAIRWDTSMMDVSPYFWCFASEEPRALGGVMTCEVGGWSYTREAQYRSEWRTMGGMSSNGLQWTDNDVFIIPWTKNLTQAFKKNIIGFTNLAIQEIIMLSFPAYWQ